MQKDLDEPEQLQSKFLTEKQIKTGVKEDHRFYGYKIGRINKPQQLQKWNIEDPQSEIVLNNVVFQMKNASVCFKQKSIEMFFERNYTTKDLQKAIGEYTNDGAKYMKEYISKAKGFQNTFIERYKVTEDYAYGCCLAMSYYTGLESQRISRTVNEGLKLYAKGKIQLIQNTEQYFQLICIGQWLFRALNCIQLHWGKVTRCINLKPQEYALYEVGNIVTWLQFSSSSYGNISAYFAVRNTRFIIYSLSGRCIQAFSNYGAAQTQVLFKPFSHFVVYQREFKDTKQYIYMRQIFIGQSKYNILWVDDNIFKTGWENKKLMEQAMVKQPLINIIPKVNTEAALAFLRSELGRNRPKSEFRIVSDMTRKNQKPDHNAGARFVSGCKRINIVNQILIFTSDQKNAFKYLQELGTRLQGVRVTVKTIDALNYLLFN